MRRTFGPFYSQEALSSPEKLIISPSSDCENAISDFSEKTVVSSRVLGIIYPYP